MCNSFCRIVEELLTRRDDRSKAAQMQQMRGIDRLSDTSAELLQWFVGAERAAPKAR
jgi:hypothetical protein